MSEAVLSTALPAPRRRWPMALALGIVFVSGAACGAALTALAIRRAVRQAVQSPELRVRRAEALISRRLRLDPAQKGRVRAILERQASDLESLRREAWPRVRETLARTEREIGAALSPEQRQRFDRMLESLRLNWGLGPSPGPTGGAQGEGRLSPLSNEADPR